MHLLAQIHNPVLPSVIGGSGNAGDVNTGGTALGTLISKIVGGLFLAAFLLAFVYLFLGGFSWITSGGDKTKLESARDQITQAIVGIIIVGAAWAITTLVGQFFGLNLKSLPIPAIPGSASVQSTSGNASQSNDFLQRYLMGRTNQ